MPPPLLGTEKLPRLTNSSDSFGDISRDLHLVRPLVWRLPFPDTRLRVVASNAAFNHFADTRLRVVLSNAALDHFAAPVFACDDEAGEKAAAETKRAESHHDDELQ